MQSAKSQTLKFGISRNDRMLPLLLGDVTVDGYDLEFIEDAPTGIFWSALYEGKFDVTEMSLAAHCILSSRRQTPFVGIPVFTSRMFRHGSIFVSERSGITTPQQLAGRRIGVPEYQMTAAVWMRGILQDDFGVMPQTVRWVTGGVNRPGRRERLELRLPPGNSVHAIEPDTTLDAMLRAGEIDAIMAPQIPESFKSGDGQVRRLFEDPRVAEQDYFARTGIFPPMHILALRRSVYENDPTLAVKLQEAFAQAKVRSFDRLYDGDAVYVMLPWLIREIEETVKFLGPDYWPYGIEANRQALDTFIGHLTDQHLLAAPISIEDIFAPGLR
jgi:4,5-dihydroxyphthalate decarboxylase